MPVVRPRPHNEGHSPHNHGTQARVLSTSNSKGNQGFEKLRFPYTSRQGDRGALRPVPPPPRSGLRGAPPSGAGQSATEVWVCYSKPGRHQQCRGFAAEMGNSAGKAGLLGAAVCNAARTPGCARLGTCSRNRQMALGQETRTRPPAPRCSRGS